MGKEVNSDGAQLAEEGKTQNYLFTFCIENRMLFVSCILVRKITEDDMQICIHMLCMRYSTKHSDHSLKMKVNGEEISCTHVRGGWVGTRVSVDVVTRENLFPSTQILLVHSR